MALCQKRIVKVRIPVLYCRQYVFCIVFFRSHSLSVIIFTCRQNFVRCTAVANDVFQPAPSDEMKRNFVDESSRLRTSYSQSFGLQKFRAKPVCSDILWFRVYFKKARPRSVSERSLSAQPFCGLGYTLKRPGHVPFPSEACLLRHFVV